MTGHPTCRDCGQPVLTGRDSDLAGITVTLDVHPVDNLGEAVALTTGRRTYSLRTVRDSRTPRRVLDERTAAVIRRGPALRPVHAEHRCGQPLPTATPEQVAWATGTEF
jgi:hypothetical protein